MLFALIYSLTDREDFLAKMTAAQNWILDHFGLGFSWVGVWMLLLCGICYFSPIGKVRIGGSNAEPYFSKWKWLGITLCTTVAIGILMWACAEPLYHLQKPAPFSSASPGSQEAISFALSTLFLHWTFTPYAIYTVPTILFAISFYNAGSEFSLSAFLQPFFPGKSIPKKLAQTLDALCLYSLFAGMTAALSAGIMTMTGGVSAITGIEASPLLNGVVCLAIVGCFAASAISGLQKGIQFLSDINFKAYLFLLAFFIVCGPTLAIASWFLPAASEYLTQFVPRSLALGGEGSSDWLKEWTIFYWAIWMAWAPLTALFLGRIAYGRTVREIIQFNLVIPAFFCGFWMLVFGGAALHIETSGQFELYNYLIEKGPGHVVFKVFEFYPFAGLISLLFLAITFLSFVTAADSTTAAMSSLSAKGIDKTNQEAPAWIKILWGTLMGFMAWVMVSFSGVEGIKISANLGGLPALIMLVPISFALLVVCIFPDSYKGSIKS